MASANGSNGILIIEGFSPKKFGLKSWIREGILLSRQLKLTAIEFSEEIINQLKLKAIEVSEAIINQLKLRAIEESEKIIKDRPNNFKNINFSQRFSLELIAVGFGKKESSDKELYS